MSLVESWAAIREAPGATRGVQSGGDLNARTRAGATAVRHVPREPVGAPPRHLPRAHVDTPRRARFSALVSDVHPEDYKVMTRHEHSYELYYVFDEL